MPRPSAASRAAAILGRAGGRARSAAKTAAVRANGRKGGRPRVPRCPECQRRETEPHKATCSWMPR